MTLGSGHAVTVERGPSRILEVNVTDQQPEHSHCHDHAKFPILAFLKIAITVHIMSSVIDLEAQQVAQADPRHGARVFFPLSSLSKW
jgi:hypothetical protein